MPRRKPTLISTFAGCGGSSLGYRWAGYRELLAVEWDRNAVKTFRLNFPDVPVWEEDIARLSVREAMRIAGLKQKGELDLLDGSPPCQGFSSCGIRTAIADRTKDTRNLLFRHFTRLLRGLGPRAFIMENVPGMVRGRMKVVFANIMGELEAAGYRVACRRLNAKWFNVPQDRTRLIFIGIRKDLKRDPVFPENGARIITAAEALDGIDPGDEVPYLNLASGRKMDDYVLRYLNRPGAVLDRIYRDGKVVFKGKYFAWRRLHPNKPAPTIVREDSSGMKLIHWTEHRGLGIPEVKALCSFPQDFQMAGTYRERYMRLGNSVMPRFMEAIAREVRRRILERAPVWKGKKAAKKK